MTNKWQINADGRISNFMFYFIFLQIITAWSWYFERYLNAAWLGFVLGVGFFIFLLRIETVDSCAHEIFRANPKLVIELEKESILTKKLTDIMFELESDGYCMHCPKRFKQQDWVPIAIKIGEKVG